MARKGPLTRADILDRVKAHALGDNPVTMRDAFRKLVLGDSARPDDGTRSFRPKGGDGGKVPLVWFHGGGYVYGGPDTHAGIGRYLSDVHGLTVHLPRIPLAPSHRWPAQLDAALRAIPKGMAPILAGDGAGGHLALVTALHLARLGRRPTALLLFSPNTDRTERSTTRAEMDSDDPVVDDRTDSDLAQMCFGGRPPEDPEVSPLLDDLSLLPPTWIEVGTPEVLLDDSRLLARAAQAAGAEVHLTVTPDLPHMAQIWAPDFDMGAESLDRAARFALEVIARDGASD